MIRWMQVIKEFCKLFLSSFTEHIVTWQEYSTLECFCLSLQLQKISLFYYEPCSFSLIMCNDKRCNGLLRSRKVWSADVAQKQFKAKEKMMTTIAKRLMRAIQLLRTIRRINFVRGSIGISMSIAVMVHFSNYFFLFAVFVFNHWRMNSEEDCKS